MKLTWRIWMLIIFLIVFTLVIINPLAFTKGLLIKEVAQNSSSAMAGIKENEILKEINGQKIENLQNYYEAIAKINITPVKFIVEAENKTFIYESKTLDFVLENDTVVEAYGKAFEAGLRKGMKVKKINNHSIESNSFEEIKQKLEPKVKITLRTNKQEYVFLTSQDLGLTLAEIPKTRITTGLDLQGGSRALVVPQEKITQQEFDSLIETVGYRLNTYGIKDVNIRKAQDILGETYMVVEVAGATPSELRELVSKQGKFEAKIGNETVFQGGKKDITFVCRNDASCAFIKECFEVQDGFACRFHFAVHLSAEAAKKQASITARLSENITEGRRYLNETLDLYLDDKLVDKLFIDADLKGKETTEVAITGSGIGKTREEAYKEAEESMKKLQTILITGSLPVKLEIVKLDSVSPVLGKDFLKSIFIASFAALFGVLLIIYLRYKRLALFVPVIIVLFSEIFLILGIAALIKWNLDLPSIAGIIAAIGTGVDDQIVMIDESRTSRQYSIKERIKRAFFIIFGAYATTFVAMLPLMWAGAGLLRGFAVTTLIGITIGVLITRPAFADILKMVVKD
ncbi:MAG: site-2 protease family protein [Candidatus Pacearchaeota archaeon]